jgi:hypothetical protein
MFQSLVQKVIYFNRQNLIAMIKTFWKTKKIIFDKKT